MTIVFTVFSNQPPEPEAAEQGIRHKEKPKKKTGGGKKKDDGNWIKIIRKPETEPREGSGRSRGEKNETGGQKQSKKKQIYREEKERKVEEQHRDELALPLPSSLQTKKDPESVKTNSQKAGGLTARERPKTERIRGGGKETEEETQTDKESKRKNAETNINITVVFITSSRSGKQPFSSRFALFLQIINIALFK